MTVCALGVAVVPVGDRVAVVVVVARTVAVTVWEWGLRVAVQVVVARGVRLWVRDSDAGVGVGVVVKVVERVRPTVLLPVGTVAVPDGDGVERVPERLPDSLRLLRLKVSLTVKRDVREGEGTDGVGVADGEAVALGLGDRLGDLV